MYLFYDTYSVRVKGPFGWKGGGGAHGAARFTVDEVRAKANHIVARDGLGVLSMRSLVAAGGTGPDDALQLRQRPGRARRAGRTSVSSARPRGDHAGVVPARAHARPVRYRVRPHTSCPARRFWPRVFGRRAPRYPSTGSNSRDDDRTVFRLLVPTLACRKFMIAGVDGFWSSLESTRRIRCSALNRRALGTRGIR